MAEKVLTGLDESYAVHVLQEMIRIPSVVGEEEKLGKYLYDELKSLGFICELHEVEPGRPNIYEAMELYELGIITDKETDGLDLSWGNDEAVTEMIERICYRKGWLGDALADGGIPAAEKIGKKSFDYLIQVKGMSNLHSDERATPGLALNIATASRGSDHLRSRPAIDLYHLPQDVLKKIYGNPVPYDGKLSSEHTAYVGKPWQVFWHENCYMGVDCLGICKYHTTFLGATLPNFEDWSKVLYYNTGLEMTPEEIWEVARRANMMERLFNLREGLTRNDLKKGDMLNHRYFDEPCRRGAIDVVGRKIDKKKFIKLSETRLRMRYCIRAKDLQRPNWSKRLKRVAVLFGRHCVNSKVRVLSLHKTTKAIKFQNWPLKKWMRFIPCVGCWKAMLLD